MKMSVHITFHEVTWDIFNKFVTNNLSLNCLTSCIITMMLNYFWFLLHQSSIPGIRFMKVAKSCIKKVDWTIFTLHNLQQKLIFAVLLYMSWQHIIRAITCRKKQTSKFLKMQITFIIFTLMTVGCKASSIMAKVLFCHCYKN